MDDPEEELIRRAFVAYFRAGNPLSDQPSTTNSHVREHEGLRYVVLGNANGALAVYRITNRGQLKRLLRYPDALNQPAQPNGGTA